MSATHRLEVWGDPIAHSRSPQLHLAAYRVLGLDWSYERRRVAHDAFAPTLAGLDGTYRGLSITYPLKDAAFRAAVRRDDRAEATGAVNTLLLGPDGPYGLNTDVGGIVAALVECGLAHPATVRIVGAGATATSALVAVAELGARRVEVAARRPEAIEPLRAIGDRLGVRVLPVRLDEPAPAAVDLTIGTLPGDAQVAPELVDALAAVGGALFDVVYGRGATALVAAWQRTGRETHTGEAMLLHQAVLQVRVFLTGDVSAPLPDEDAVVGAMRNALVGD